MKKTIIMVFMALIAVNVAAASTTYLIKESPYGASYKILQLERAALKSMLAAQIMAEQLPGQDLSVQVGCLEEAYGEAKTLEANTDVTKDFIRIKKEITDANTKLRVATKTILTTQNVKDIKKALDSNQELKRLQSNTRTVLRNLNAYRVADVMKAMGEPGSEVVNRVKNGQLSLEEARETMQRTYDQLNELEKERAREKLTIVETQRTQLRESSKTLGKVGVVKWSK